MKNEFYDHYKNHVIPALQKQHGYKNIHQIPKVEKVVVNTSVGSQSDVKQALEDAKAELALITGQKPAETRAKKSIANFKLRKEQAIGAKVTLRGAHMYEFLERLIKAALPAHSRLSWRFAARFRRSRQLHPGRFRPGDLPRSRARQNQAQHRF